MNHKSLESPEEAPAMLQEVFVPEKLTISKNKSIFLYALIAICVVGSIAGLLMFKEANQKNIVPITLTPTFVATGTVFPSQEEKVVENIVEVSTLGEYDVLENMLKLKVPKSWQREVDNDSVRYQNGAAHLFIYFSDYDTVGLCEEQSKSFNIGNSILRTLVTTTGRVLGGDETVSCKKGSFLYIKYSIPALTKLSTPVKVLAYSGYYGEDGWSEPLTPAQLTEIDETVKTIVVL